MLRLRLNTRQLREKTGGNPEALPLLLTLSSGVTGYTTIHAGSARQGLTRLRFVAQLAEAARDLPVSALNALVSDSVDLVVHTERTGTGPRVTSILALEDQATGADAVNLTTTEVFLRGPRGSLQWSGLVPARLRERMDARGEDLMALLDRDSVDRRHERPGDES